MRANFTSSSWVEAGATLAASILMTVAGFTALRDLPATPAETAVAPTAVPRVSGAAQRTPKAVALPHVDTARG